MPEFVLKKISYDVNEKTIQDDTGIVCVLFADIQDFDEIIKNY